MPILIVASRQEYPLHPTIGLCLCLFSIKFCKLGSVVDAAGVNVAFNEDVVVVIARREVLGPTACDSMVLTYSTSVATGSADGSISITGISEEALLTPMLGAMAVAGKF